MHLLSFKICPLCYDNLYGVSEHTHYLDGNVPWVWLKNQSAIKSCSNWRSSRNSCISMHLTQHNSAQMHLTQLNTTHKTNMCNSTQLVYLNASYSTQLTKLVQLNTTLATYQSKPTSLGNRRPCWFLWALYRSYFHLPLLYLYLGAEFFHQKRFFSLICYKLLLLKNQTQIQMQIKIKIQIANTKKQTNKQTPVG